MWGVLCGERPVTNTTTTHTIPLLLKPFDLGAYTTVMLRSLMSIDSFSARLSTIFNGSLYLLRGIQSVSIRAAAVNQV